jgi:hypothetical protein
MGGDISRSTFDPTRRYSSVRQQQGRVTLDADWNEQVDIAAHRLHTHTVDLLGVSGAPRDSAGFDLWAPGTPGGFAANDMILGAGRIYVDGHLCELVSTPVAIENFTGDGTATTAGTQIQLLSTVLDGTPLQAGQWVLVSAQSSTATGATAPDSQLAQVTAADPATGSVTLSTSVISFGPPNTSPQLQRLTTYLTQPDYYPNPPQVRWPGSNAALAYLDVWERPITALNDPSIQEVALGGPDTTTRTKTVWQLKVAQMATINEQIACSSPTVAAQWQTLTQPSAAVLTNGVVASIAAGPCSIAANPGFSGMENQLYRVEIHQPGTLATGLITYPIPAGTATFKWSRDNASVSTGVTAITAAANSGGTSTSQLTVLSTGRDAVLSFAPQSWIEITDDYLELSGQSGELHQIDSNGVDQTRSTITLATPVSAALLTRFTGPVNYHTRICRWDQSGQVLEAGSGTLWVDLNATGSTGDIPVPPAGTTLVLENGITVSFGLSSTTGSILTADSWTFAARTADGSIQSLVQASPSSIEHHYCRLATISFQTTPWTINDCRQVFAPLADPGLHVTNVLLAKPPQQLLNDSTITVQQLAAGISIACDGAIDPTSITQPTSTQAISGSAQATCFATINLPLVNAGAIYGFQLLTLSANVSLDPTDTTNSSILWAPTTGATSWLTTQMTTLATQTSQANPPVVPTLLARLTLKGNAIWANGNPGIYIDGETLTASYDDANNIQRTGLILPSGNGHPGGDFSTWFWLTSSPALILSPPSLSFSPTLVGQTTAAQTVTLTNTTAAAVPITVTVGGNVADFPTSTPLPTSVAANAATTISVSFKPTAAGAWTAALNIAGAGMNLSTALSGTGLNYALSAAPNSVPFGSIALGGTSTQTVTLTNTGTQPVTITSITTASTVFTNTFTSSSLAPNGGTCTVTVVFTPAIAQAYTDELTVNTTPAGLLPLIQLTGSGYQRITTGKEATGYEGTGNEGTSNKNEKIQVVHPIQFVNPVLDPARKQALATNTEAAEPATARAFIEPAERPQLDQVLQEPEAPQESQAPSTPEDQEPPK